MANLWALSQPSLLICPSMGGWKEWWKLISCVCIRKLGMWDFSVDTSAGHSCGHFLEMSIDPSLDNNNHIYTYICMYICNRSKRLAPVLIKEITRRVNLQNIWQAVYTAGVVIPKPVSRCRYWHRSLNPKKLYEVGHFPSCHFT